MAATRPYSIPETIDQATPPHAVEGTIARAASEPVSSVVHGIATCHIARSITSERPRAPRIYKKKAGSRPLSRDPSECAAGGGIGEPALLEQLVEERPQDEGEPVSVECAYNGCVIGMDHHGIRCQQGHHFCPECSVASLVTSYLDGLNNGTTEYPLKCLICQAPLLNESFAQLLNEEELTAYNAHAMRYQLGEDETKADCPSCKYFEVWDKPAQLHFLFCGGDACGRVSCYLCKEDVTEAAVDVRGDTDVCRRNAMMLERATKHQVCVRFAQLKARFDEAVELGMHQCCPSCGVQGQKDEACTHMYCVCGRTWCYCCAGLKEEVDMAEGADREEIYHHNTEWQFLTTRCPMYLHEMGQIHGSWSLTEGECVEVFHQRKTLKLLRALVDDIGVETYQALASAYPSVEHSGFTIEEIMAFNEEVLPERLPQPPPVDAQTTAPAEEGTPQGLVE